MQDWDESIIPMCVCVDVCTRNNVGKILYKTLYSTEWVIVMMIKIIITILKV